MSDTMLIGVLSMPRELREADAMSKMQFDSRVKEACEELTKRADEIDELKRKIEEHNKRCEDDCGHSMCRPSEMQRCYDCPKDWRIDL